MKIDFKEFDGCFGLELVAENMTEAALLVRFGTNYVGNLRHVSTTAQAGVFTTSIVFKKHARADGFVQKRK